MKRIAVFFEDYWESVDTPLFAAAALLCMWIFLLFGNSQLVFVDTAEQELLPPAFLMITSVIVLALWYGSARAGVSWIRKPLLESCSLIALVFCSLCFLFAEQYPALRLIGLTLTGLAFPLCLMFLLKRFALLSFRRRIATTASAGVFSAIGLGILVLLPASINLVLSAFLPLGAMYACSKKASAEEEAAETKGSKPQILVSYNASFAITIFTYGFLISFIAGGALATQGFESNLSTLLASGLFVVVTAIITFYMYGHASIEDANAAYKPAPLLIGLGFALLPFAGPAVLDLCCALVFTGFGVFFVYYWIVIGNHIQKFHWDFVQAGALALLYLFTGIALGYFLLRLLSLVPGDFLTLVGIVGLVLIIILLWLMAKGEYYANEPGQDSSVFKFGGTPDLQTEDDAALLNFFTTYGISEREGDVIRLLIKGRNVPYICDELFIAKSTVQTHIKHIYAKTSVSNRQELLDLISRKPGTAPTK